MVDRDAELAALRAHFLKMRAEAEAGLAKCDLLAPPAPASAPTPVFMTTDEYAQRRSVSVATIRKWIHMGLPTRRVGRVVRIIVAAADEWDMHATVRRSVEVHCATGRNH